MVTSILQDNSICVSLLTTEIWYRIACFFLQVRDMIEIKNLFIWSKEINKSNFPSPFFQGSIGKEQ